MATAFGPQGPNFATVRPPADPNASGGLHTWFKNCTAAGAKDGTFATAAFFNVIVANLREAVTAGGIALNDADDEMLEKAIRAIALQVLNTNLPTALQGRKGVRILGGWVESSLGTGTLPVLTAA